MTAEQGRDEPPTGSMVRPEGAPGSRRAHSTDPAGGALLRTASGAVQAFVWVLAGRGRSVADNIVLTMRFHPVGGEDVSVVCEDFAGEREALEAVARALDERPGLVLTRARYDR